MLLWLDMGQDSRSMFRFLGHFALKVVQDYFNQAILPISYSKPVLEYLRYLLNEYIT